MSVQVRCISGCLLKIPNKKLGQNFACPKCGCSIRIEKATDPNQKYICEAVGVDGTDTNSFPDVVSVETNDSPSTFQMLGRLERARQDRMLLSKFIASFIFLIGAINLVPAIYNLSVWKPEIFGSAFPAWIYLQIMVASLHIIYAIFLWQIGDWSATKTVSFVFLIFAAGYTFFTTSLMLGGFQSEITRFLGITYTMFNTAKIWCSAMMLLCIVTSFLAIKEAYSWKKLESLINEMSPE